MSRINKKIILDHSLNLIYMGKHKIAMINALLSIFFLFLINKAITFSQWAHWLKGAPPPHQTFVDPYF